MPYTLDTQHGTSLSVSDDFQYKYPDGLDLRPGSPLHQMLLTKVLSRARESSLEMSKRYSLWKKIDRNLTAFVTPDDDETKVKDADERKPVAVVVPFSYATLETLLTYMTVAFLNPPIFKYSGNSPEDTIGAILLEKVINTQCIRSKMPLNLHTQFRDSYAYGIGVSAPVWEKQWGYRTVVRNEGFLSTIFGKWMDLGTKAKSRERTVLYEGNTLRNIDPYMYLPDPNVPVHEVQKGEFVGWIESTNYLHLLEQERYDASIFNVKYLKGVQGRSMYNKGRSESGRADKFGGMTYPGSENTTPIDVIWMYVKLIPKDWGIGTQEYPEKYLFGVAADKAVIACKPLGLNHDMFPINVCAPDFDGHSTSAISRLELVYGLQETLDFLFMSHVTNIRKAINDMLIVDPSLINVNDLRDPAPGKLIRMRRAAWGRGVENAVKQLKVEDVTKGHIQDSAVIIDLIQKCTGSVDSVMGIQRTSSERVSAEETRGTRSSALSRLGKSARIISLQTMYDLGYMLASHTQQLMSKSLYVDVTGEWQDRLMEEYGVTADGRVKVDPFQLVIDYDVIQGDGSVQLGEGADLWIQLYQIAAQNPLVAQGVDMKRVFTHIARMLGAKDVNDFMVKGKMPPVNMSVQPDANVEKQVQAGNLVPLS